MKNWWVTKFQKPGGDVGSWIKVILHTKLNEIHKTSSAYVSIQMLSKLYANLLNNTNLKKINRQNDQLTET